MFFAKALSCATSCAIGRKDPCLVKATNVIKDMVDIGSACSSKESELHYLSFCSTVHIKRIIHTSRQYSVSFGLVHKVLKRLKYFFRLSTYVCNVTFTLSKQMF